MMQQRFKQEFFAKPGAPRPEELLPSPHVKNTPGGVNGQHFRLTPKSGHNPIAPGARLSATPHRDEAAARLTPTFPTLDCASQMPLRSPVPDSENLPPRRPLKLAPLELPEVAREAQKEKPRSLPQEAAKATSRKLDMGGNEPCPRKVKACVRKGPVKAPGHTCPSLMLSEPVKEGLPPPPPQQQGAAAPRVRLARSRPVELSGDHLEAVVCRGTPAPSKPAPPSLFPSVNANARTPAAARGGELGTCRSGSTALHQQEQQETGRRRLRLRRAERLLEEDQGKSNTSTGGLSADESKVAQGLPQRRGQQQQRTELGTLRLLEKESKRNPLPQQPGNTMEVSGRALRRIAVSNLQDASPLLAL